MASGLVALSWCDPQHPTPRSAVSGGAVPAREPCGDWGPPCPRAQRKGGHIPAASLCRGQADSEAPEDITPRFQIPSALSCISQALDVDLRNFFSAFLIFN